MIQDLIVCFARHKCASGWQSEILIDVCRELGLQFGYVHNEESFGHHIGRHVENEGIDVLVFGNAQTSYLDDLPPYRGFHTVRDPRDIIVSAYFSHRNSHELQDWLEDHRQALLGCDKDEGLHLQMDFWLMEYMLNQMREWDYDNERILELRWETLTGDPSRELRRAFEFVGLFDRGLSSETFQELLAKHSFEAKSGGRSRGDGDAKSHYRRGVPGDWRNHFGPYHVQKFKSTYGDLVLDWGYENGGDWNL